MYEQQQPLNPRVEKIWIEVTAGDIVARYAGDGVPGEIEPEVRTYIDRAARYGVLEGSFTSLSGSKVHVWLNDAARRRGIHFVDYGR